MTSSFVRHVEAAFSLVNFELMTHDVTFHQIKRENCKSQVQRNYKNHKNYFFIIFFIFLLFIFIIFILLYYFLINYFFY